VRKIGEKERLDFHFDYIIYVYIRKYLFQAYQSRWFAGRSKLRGFRVDGEQL